MAVNIIDLVPSFLAYWEAVASLPREEQARRWETDYAASQAALFAAAAGRLGNQTVLPGALARYPAVAPILVERAALVRDLVPPTRSAVRRCFALDHQPVPLALMVGMFWSDAWVVPVAGVDTVCIAVELLRAPAQCRILLAHELAHLAHAACNEHAWQTADSLAWNLFVEGLAVVASRQLEPHPDAASALWIGWERTSDGGEPVVAWLARCRSAWPVLRPILARRLAGADRELYRQLFLGDTAVNGMPFRIGYAVGYWLVHALTERYSLAALARWDHAQVLDAFAELLAGPLRELPADDA